MTHAPAPPDPPQALWQPTRARLFTLLSDLARPASTNELAQRLRLHPNGVRAHLELLRQAGLLTRARTQPTRGRPADAWSIAPDTVTPAEPPGAYHDLGCWLARALAARPTGLRSIERTGREIGREIAPGAARSPADGLQDSLAVLGFRPAVTAQDNGDLTVRLGNCPYRDAVRENPPAVCALHRGITQGLLDGIQPRAKLTAFVPHDPDEAGCVIKVRDISPGPS